MDKKELRKILRKKRGLVTGKSLKDDRISQRVMEEIRYLMPDTVLIYVSYGSEVCTSDIIRQLLSENFRVAVPKCGENGSMDFLYIRSADELSEGAYGIPEPTGSEKAVITEKTVCIVPALSFTADGDRMGYGGGYYDRFLSAHPFVNTFGLCYAELISDNLPCEPHDCKVKNIITEERTVHCIA